MTTWKGIPGERLAEHGITVDERGTVRIPYRDEHGHHVRDRIFYPDGRCSWGRGGDICPYGLETLPASHAVRARSVLFAAEGESDTLTLREHAAAIAYPDGTVLDCYAIGLPGALSWRPAWARHAAGFHRVYLAGDGDQAGRAMNTRVRASIPHARILELADGDDARALLQRPGGPDELAALIERADQDERLLEAFLTFTNVDQAHAWLAGQETRRAA